MQKIFIAFTVSLSMTAAENTIQYFFVYKKDMEVKLAEMRYSLDKIQGVDDWNWKYKHQHPKLSIPKKETQKSYKPSIDPLD